jgi:hypothetical protein
MGGDPSMTRMRPNEPLRRTKKSMERKLLSPSPNRKIQKRKKEVIPSSA